MWMWHRKEREKERVKLKNRKKGTKVNLLKRVVYLSHDCAWNMFFCGNNDMLFSHVLGVCMEKSGQGIIHGRMEQVRSFMKH